MLLKVKGALHCLDAVSNGLLGLGSPSVVMASVELVQSAKERGRADREGGRGLPEGKLRRIWGSKN